MTTRVWKGNSGLWTDTSQWLPNGEGIPLPGDTVIVSGGSITITGLTLSDENVDLSGSAPITLVVADLTLDGLSKLVANDSNGLQLNSDRNFVNDGTIDFEDSGEIYVGYFGNATDFLQNGFMKTDAALILTFHTNHNTLVNQGTISVGPSGSIVFNDDGASNVLENEGLLLVDSQAQPSAIYVSITGNGSIQIGPGSEVVLGAAAGGQTVSFLGSSGTLTLDGNDLTGGLFGAHISGFRAGDTINLGTDLVDAVRYDPQSNVLTTLYAGVQTGTLAIVGDFDTSEFALASNGSGTLLTTDVLDTGTACFVEGTLILTDSGEVPVEQLCVGDLVKTLGEPLKRPVLWVGRRRVICEAHHQPQDVWPVCVTAGAFGPSQPARDLWLSPDHAIFYAGILIPVRYLLNGATVFQRPVARVTYYHVELDSHGILLSDGLYTESYLDTGNRSAFENTGSTVAAQAEDSRRVWASKACAPLRLSGEEVAACRSMLILRAVQIGYQFTTDPDARLVGTRGVFRGERLGLDYVFPKAEVCGCFWLQSRVSVPAYVSANCDDTRRLGLAVSALSIDGKDALNLAEGDGWYAAESGWRWTDGNARLFWPDRARNVSLRTAIQLQYWISPDTELRQ